MKLRHYDMPPINESKTRQVIPDLEKRRDIRPLRSAQHAEATRWGRRHTSRHLTRSLKKKLAMDQVVAVVAFHKDKWVVLGAGESRKKVEALAKRWDEDEALKPPETKQRVRAALTRRAPRR